MKECVVCNTKFKDSWALNRHREDVDCSDYNCLECGKVMQYTSTKGRRKYICGDECRKERKRKDALQYNRRPEVAARHRKYDLLPETKRRHNERLRLKTKLNPVVANCIVCEKEFKKEKGWKTCGAECSKQHRDNFYQNPTTRMSARISLAIRRVLGGKRISDNAWNFVDFTPDDFRKRFESLFTDGMSWDNMSEWHIDHIRPVASFNYDSTEHPDFKKCWALNNLQPLWAVDNMSKGDKWNGIINA